MKKIIMVCLLSIVGRTLSMEQQNPINNLLFQGIMNNNVATVEKALSNGADVNALMSHSKISAAEVALAQGNSTILKMIIERKPNLETRYFQGHTLLIRAAYENKLELAKILLEGNADVNAQSSQSKKTALDNAYEKRNYELMEILIGFGAKFHLCKTSEDILHKACNINFDPTSKPPQTVVNYLLEQARNNPTIRIRQNFHLVPALHYLMKAYYKETNSAIKNMLLSRINEQIKNGYNINNIDGHGNTPLIIAIENRDSAMIKQLIETHGSRAMLTKDTFNSNFGTFAAIPKRNDCMQHVLNQLDFQICIKENFDYNNYKTYYDILKLMLEKNNELWDYQMKFVSTQETMSLFEFATKNNLEEIIQILQQCKMPTLLKITAKNIIFNPEAINYENLLLLPMEMIEYLSKEISNHSVAADYKQRFDDLKTLEISESLISKALDSKIDALNETF